MSWFGAMCLYCKGPDAERRNGLYLCASCDDRFTEGDPRLPPSAREQAAQREKGKKP